jgi:toxin ParE1/3/4
MTFEFHPDALAEYEESAAWYEERRSRLGIEFADSVEAAISAILESPDRFQPVDGGVRVFRLKRFPFNVFYRHNEMEGHVSIVALMHHKRRPDHWRERL